MRERDKECSQSTLDAVVADEAPAVPPSRIGRKYTERGSSHLESMTTSCARHCVLTGVSAQYTELFPLGKL